jgi:hypothetical protein
MIGELNANALTAAGMASFAAKELSLHGLSPDDDAIREAAAACVAPLLRSAAIALELSGLMAQECSAGVHDIITDYISAPPAEPVASARRVA